MFLFTPDQARGKPLRQAVGKGLSELKATLGEVRRRSGIRRFLVARMIYQDGVNSITALGAGYAASLFHWSITEIGLYGMFTIIIATFSCLIASRMDTRFGSKAIVMIAVVLLLLATIGMVSTGRDYLLFGLVTLDYSATHGLFTTSAEHAYLFYGILLGTAFGPVQASSRSWFARSVKPEESGRYFGIYALSGRATSFLGPFWLQPLLQSRSRQRWECRSWCCSSLSGSIWRPSRHIRQQAGYSRPAVTGRNLDIQPAYSIQPSERCTAFSQEQNSRVLSSTGIRGCQRWPTCQFSMMSCVDFQ